MNKSLSPPAPAPRATLAARIADALRADILGGRLPPAAAVPTETELAARFATNRNTVREALRALEAQDLIRVSQGARARVRDFRREAQLNLLPAYLLSPVAPPERAQVVRDLLVFRLLLLEEAAGLAAVRASPEDGRALLACARAQRATSGDLAATIRGDLEFYRALVVATHSVVVVWSFNTFVRLFESVVSAVPTLFVLPPGYLDSLEEIARAISSRQPRRAKKLVRHHLAAGDRKLLALLGGVPARPRRRP